MLKWTENSKLDSNQNLGKKTFWPSLVERLRTLLDTGQIGSNIYHFEEDPDFPTLKYKS